jgi:two-component system cell cycle sensor histidine kinase/response regulator CckA
MGVLGIALVVLAAGLAALICSWRAHRGALLARQHALESQYRSLDMFRSSVVPQFLMNVTTGTYIEVNDAFGELTGRTRDELIGHSNRDLHLIDSAIREELQRKLREHGHVRNFETKLYRKNGEARDVVIAMDAVRIEGVVHTCVVLTDITKLRQAQEQLRQTQKLESLGLLAGGVAHDFNNMLAVISSCSSMLAESIPAGSPDRELVDDIEGAVTRATSLTRQLLAFSRKQVVQPHVLDLNGVVKDTFKMLRRMVGEDIILTTSLDPDLPRVFIDPGNLVQVLMNLAVNARDAMPRGGSLDLRTRSHGGMVELLVTDSGCGMSEETKAHVFEPFFTTKPHGKGTGMGLAVVHGIIDQAGGRITIDSVVGEGTTFHIFLPVSAAAADVTTEAGVVVENGIETILLVDDDDYLRRSAARALRSRGYTVVEAGSGKAALDAFRDRAGIHLLLTDVVMPGMDGRELAELVRAQCPAAKVLYMSGYTDDAVVRHGVSQGDVILIEKPFRIRALAGKIREVLDA